MAATHAGDRCAGGSTRRPLRPPTALARSAHAARRCRSRCRRRRCHRGRRLGGGGGSGSSGGTKFVYDDPYKAYDAFGKALHGDKANGPQMQGLTRKLASGENIGSQIDDIFKMISRRYQAKTAEKIFVDPVPTATVIPVRGR